MGKVVEKKGKKKKGRPSLLDIQKRNLRLQKEQQQQQQQQKNPNPNFKYPNSNPNPPRRFTRRNPDPDAIAAENGDNDDDDNDDDDSKGSRRERKLNHVLRVPPNQRSAVNSPYLDLGLYGSDSNDDDDDDDDDDETPLKKRKINAAAAVGDGSAHNAAKKGEKQNSAWKATEKNIGTPLDSGPTTPLPDKKLLVFILDRIQKKDTYAVYAEPVDPDELPDYHEIIENPMDFGTVRKKLEDGAYANLEQFESDVFLITSNAMQYNAPDTIYFRQARTMQELAKKNFENLRLDSDNENKPKIVRRGRPPTKHLKKSLGKTSSEFDGLDGTPTKGGDNAAWSNSYNLRKGHQSDKYVSADTSRRAFYGSRNSDAYSWLLEHKSEKSDEFLGSSMKGFSMKYGKKQFVADESRRNTYMNFHPSVVGSQSSVLNTFDGETKQLLPVGLHTEHGYARSLARFAANLGPVAWKVASKKIARSLPPGMKFGPGWVGDDEAPPVPTTSLLTPSSSCSLPQQPPFPSIQTSPSPAMSPRIESRGDVLFQEYTSNSSLDGYPNSRPIHSSFTSISRCPEPAEAGSMNTTDGRIGLMSSNGSGGGIRPPFQIHQRPGMNGFGSHLSSQMGKLVVGPGGSINSDTSVHSRILDIVSKSNFIHSSMNHSELNPKLLGSSSSNPAAIPETCWNGLLVQQKPDSISTDLNVRFQSPGSPSSKVMVDSPQPDLALQL